MIESVNNERVKYWAKLNTRKYQDEEGLFLVEGEHLVEEANKAGYLKEVIILEGYDYNYKNKNVVSTNVVKKISSLVNVPNIIGVVKKLESREVKGRVVLLDRIQDPGNLGTIIRSAVAFGIDTVVLGEGSVSIYNPKVVRATEGLLFHINIIEDKLENVISTLKKQNYKLYATDVMGGKSLNTIEFPQKTGIVMGNEGSGVSEGIKKSCDEYLYIEMDETCESLNVGVATSIILYEMSKK